MNFDQKLAIIIPAYKIDFFEQSIQSIANQTCKDFTLYVGDDASPHDFIKIIDLYKHKINIVYKRFEENWGSNDLVKHWNRCIDLLQNEDWIWFFSDDDIMDKNCVELFYEHVRVNNHYDLLHFNIHIINEKNVQLFRDIKFQPNLSVADFFNGRVNGKYKSCVVEYIFKRKIFEKVNRFENFDLAWGSDDATWLKLSVQNGINTIDGAFVSWRQSSLNISPMLDSKTVLRKVNAMISYIKWAKDFFVQNDVCDISTDLQKAVYTMRVVTYASSLGYKEKYHLVDLIIRSLQFSKIRTKIILYWVILEIKERIKIVINYNEILKRKSKEVDLSNGRFRPYLLNKN